MSAPAKVTPIRTPSELEQLKADMETMDNRIGGVERLYFDALHCGRTTISVAALGYALEQHLIEGDD
jgi:hypothetical protein